MKKWAIPYDDSWETGIPHRPIQKVHYNEYGYAESKHTRPTIGSLVHVVQNTNTEYSAFSGMPVIITHVYDGYDKSGFDCTGIVKESIEQYAQRMQNWSDAPESDTPHSIESYIELIRSEYVDENGNIVVDLDSLYLDSADEQKKES